MEPRIQYAKTKDGVSIAYSTLGEGSPLVCVPSPEFSHIQAEWQLPGASSYYERLARRRMIVHYDGRGTGLSDRDVTDFSLDTFLLDLDAIVDRLGLKSFDLLGSLGGGPVAIAYAAGHPELVSHLLLWCSYSPSSDLQQGTPELETVLALIDKDWVIYTETIVNMYLGWSGGEPANRGAAYLRESVSQETLKALVDSLSKTDATEFLPQVGTPTLVLCRRENMSALRDARFLAAGMPDARLAVLEGQSLIPYIGDSEAVLSAMAEFLGEGEEEEVGTPAAAGGFATGRRLAAIMFTDIVGYTTLMAESEEKGLRVRARHRELVRPLVEQYHGEAIEARGDESLSVFPSVLDAVNCALAIEERLRDDPELKLHVGIHLGDLIVQDGEVSGDGVNIASRICSLSEGGGLCVSGEVYRSIRNQPRIEASALGEQELKNVPEPVAVYSVSGQADAPSPASWPTPAD